MSDYVLPEKYRNQPELKKHLLHGIIVAGRTLGVGSFGTVVELEIGGTRCAGKKIHDILLGVDGQVELDVVGKFVEECRLMSAVKHPNIVQFMGLCFLEGDEHPVIVMEYLDMSLDFFLHVRKGQIPLSLKLRILLDVSRGLVYLHTYEPSIIHRDLTSRNVLINSSSMQAKIADLGNSLMTDPGRLMNTLSKMPGTPLYMPPEATGLVPKYDCSLDIFSYGQLALYVVNELFPSKLLAATFTDPVTEVVKGYSEVERRKQYFDLLYDDLGANHPLSTLIEGCLHNVPTKRPTARQLMDGLEQLVTEQDDVYAAFKDASKLDLIHLLNWKSDVSGAYATYQPIGGSQELYRARQLRAGAVGVMEIYMPVPTGALRRKKELRWKQFVFQIVKNDMGSLNLQTKKRDHRTPCELELDKVTSVSIRSSERRRFTFEVHFSSTKRVTPSSPWILSTDTKEERTSWMDAIKPGSAAAVVAKDGVEEPYAISDGTYMTIVAQPDTKPVSVVDSIPQLATNQSAPPMPPGKPDHSDPDSLSFGEYDEIPDLQDFDSSNEVQNQMCDNDPLSFLAQLPSAASQENQHSELPNLQPPSEPQKLKINCKPPDFSEALTNDILPTSSLLELSPASQRPPASKNDVVEEIYEDVQDVCTHLGHVVEAQAGTPPPLPKPRSKNTLRSRLPASSIEIEASQLKMLIEMHEILNRMATIYETPIQAQTTPPQPVMVEPRSSPIAPKKQLILNYENFENKSLERRLQQTASAKRPFEKPPIPQPRRRLETFSSEIDGTEVMKSGSMDSIHRAQGSESLTIEQRKKQLFKDMGGSTVTTPGQRDVAGMRDKLDSLQSKTRKISSQDMLDTEGEAVKKIPAWAKASTSSLLKEDDSLNVLRQQALFIPKSQVKIHQMIGKGQFSKVYKGSYQKESGTVTVAVKTIKKYESEKETNDFLREMDVMSQLLHPNIIKLYGIVQQDNPWIVVEYLPHGDLKTFLQKNHRPIETLVKYMLDISMGMLYIAEKGLIHRDIAARNIIVGTNHSGMSEMCKVSDFGLLREIPKDDSIYVAQQATGPVPIRWMAPESLSRREFSLASDVWSYGILQWELLNPDKHPYMDLQTSLECALHVSQGYRLEIPEAYPEIVQKIMKACGQKDPRKRPSFFLISTLLSNEIVTLC